MNILVLGRAKTGTTILAKNLQANLAQHRLWFEPRSLNHFFSPRSQNVVTKVIFEHWDDRPHSRLALINNEMEMKFQKRIAIVRDPRDELVSRMFFMVRGAILDRDVPAANVQLWIELIRAKEANPRAISLTDMLARMNELLDAHLGFDGGASHAYLGFVQRHFAEHHIVRYEAFIDGERQALCDYLGFPLAAEPADDMQIERTRRSAGHGGWKHLFLDTDLAAYMARNADLLAAAGYAESPLPTEPRLDPRHGSDYVARLAAAAFAEKAAQQAAAAVPPAPTFAAPPAGATP